MARRGPRDSSRDAILQAFAERVADRGYAETSLGDVAGSLGLSKGTILHHFASKEAVLGEVHIAYFSRRFAEADHVLRELPDPPSRLVAMIYALLAAHRDDRAASLACLRELDRYFVGELNDYVRAQRERYTAIVLGIVRDGCADGLFHTADPAMTTLHVFGMCNYAWTWYRPDGRRSVEEIAQVFARDVLGGLLHKPEEDAEVDEVVRAAIATVLAAPGRLPTPAVAPHRS